MTLELYPIASVVQGKTYTVQSQDANRTIQWRADNKRFRRMLLCCPWCNVIGIWMWRFEFEDLNLRKKRTMRQRGKTLSWRRWWPQIAPGQESSDTEDQAMVDQHQQQDQQDQPIVFIRDQEI